MQELIKVTEKDNTQFVQSLKEIYLGAEMDKTHWSRWCKTNIEDNLFFVENQDYQTFTTMANGNETKDYVCTLEMAKHLVMQMSTKKAFEYRNYLIELEKAWNSPDKIMARALQIAQKEIENYKKEIEYQKPKVEFYDQIIDSKDTIDIGSLAKTLNIRNLGRNKLFEILRERKILDSKNQPYQTYIDRGYFRTIETSYIQGGDVKIHIKTVVFQKGVDYINKLLKTE